LYPATASALLIEGSTPLVKPLFTVYVPVLLFVAASMTISPLLFASTEVVVVAPLDVALLAVAPVKVV